MSAAAAAPAAPTLVRPFPDRPLQFADLAAMARWLHRERGARGLRLGPERVASYGGSETFKGFMVIAVDDQDGGERYLGYAAIQGRPADDLRAALRAAEPEADQLSDAA